MTIRAFKPAQLVGVPDKVRMKVSQFTPSTHVLSSNEPPPAALPAQCNVGPAGPSVSGAGFADRDAGAKSARIRRPIAPTKNSVPMVTRALRRKGLVFINFPFVLAPA